MSDRADVLRAVVDALGDDGTDEIACAALPQDVVSVRVGLGPTAARFQLDDVAFAEDLLGDLSIAVGGLRLCE